jgi:6-phosphogluconolactonase
MDIQVSVDSDTLAVDAARHIAGELDTAIKNRGFATLVLPGGNTPRPVYRVLARDYRDTIDWSSVFLFWGDDRCVPYDHDHSNVKPVMDYLVKPLGLDEDQVVAMPTSIEPRDSAALFYQESIRLFFAAQGIQVPAGEYPRFDLCILGMGDDGHTASLFPGNDNDLAEIKKWVIPVFAPLGKPPGYRLSLTLPVINNSREVLFLVNGGDKSDIIAEIFMSPETAAEKYPAARIAPEDGASWIIDQDAASKLVSQ